MSRNPERVFVIVVEAEGGRDPNRMPLLNRDDRRGNRVTPVFSSMQQAITFLSEAQEVGHRVRLDYIFPADPRRLAEDFPDYQVVLDPSPAAFFGSDPGH